MTAISASPVFVRCSRLPDLRLRLGAGSTPQNGIGNSLQIERIRIAGRIPEMENIDRSVLFIDGVDDPVLRAAADTKEVGAVGRAREREIGPGEGRLAEIDREDVAEPIDLLDGEFFAVIAKVDGELIDVALRDRVDA